MSKTFPWIITPVTRTRTEDPLMEGFPTFATASRKVVSTIIYHPAPSLEPSSSNIEIVPLQESPECLREKRGYSVSYLAFTFPENPCIASVFSSAYDDPFALPSFIILISVRLSQPCSNRVVFITSSYPFNISG